MKNLNNTIVKLIRNWFISGLVLLIPLFLTIYIFVFVFNIVDDIFWGILSITHQNMDQIKNIPGIGVITVLSFITLVGMLGKTYLFGWIIKLIRSLFTITPVFRPIFNAITSIMNSLFSGSSKSFREVVLLEYPNKGNFVYAFVTNSHKSGEIFDLVNKSNPTKEVVVLFVPTTPNPTSGFMIITSVESVSKVNISINLAMTMIISGGIITEEQKNEQLKK